MYLTLKLTNLTILEKQSKQFGNSAHAPLPKSLLNKKVKIIIGNSKQTKNQLQISLNETEILERKVKPYGTGAHILLPKEHSNKKIKIILQGGIQIK